MGSNSDQLSDHTKHCFFRHNEKQTNTPVEGTLVSGKIPTWVEGKLLRNGPGIQKIGEYQYNHMFDGLSVLHNFIIKDGKAYYQSRALESEAYERDFAANRIVVGEFGTQAFPDPCQSMLGSLQTKFSKLMGRDKSGMEMSDNCCVNVGYYGDQLYAMTETVFLRRIDPESLKSIGDKTRIRDYCALNTATAHPHVLEDGTNLNVGNKFKDPNGAQYLFVSVPPASADDPEPAYKNAKIIAQIPSRWKYNPAYFHSFGLTKDKLIFVEQPYCVNLFAALSRPITRYSYQDCLKWHTGEKSILHVISLKDGKPHSVQYETDNLFTFHHINAYEENGSLIVDIAGYDNADFVTNATIHAIKTARNCVEGASPRRYILPLNVEGAEPGKNLVESFKTSATATLRKGTTNVVDVVPHHFTNNHMELPRINYKLNGLKYNFFYGLETNDPTPAVPYWNTITKIDIAKGSRIIYPVPAGCMASEPIFVADPSKPDADEDEGVILSTYLVQSDPTCVFLLVLNAKDLTEISKVQFRAEGAVTGTFHGIWKHD